MSKENFFHDHGYKYLFSNPTLVRYLITTFVKEDWVKDIDFTRMEKLDKEFIDEEYDRRESDIIYKVSFQGKEAYIFLLIEFQSYVDRFMALRVLHYICKFYLDLLELHKYKTLPPVFPVVLYNGNERWSAPAEIEDLIENVKGLEGYVPKFKYCKIAENEYSKQELEKVKNLISALFYIENSSAEEIQKALGQIVDIIASEKDKSAVKRFIIWFKNLAERKQLKGEHGEDYTFYNPLEVKNMLSATLDKIRIKEREEGREKGRKEEVIGLLKIYLMARFNEAPEEIMEQLRVREDIQELENLASKIYQCQSLEEIAKVL